MSWIQAFKMSWILQKEARWILLLVLRWIMKKGMYNLYIETWNRIKRWILECKMNWILDQENELDSGVGDERDTRAGSWMNWV